MYVEHHHDLTSEFPEYRDRVHDLQVTSPQFARLYEQYQEIDKQIYRIEQEIETRSDEYTENLKKRRVLLKDQLYAMLKA